VVLQLPFAAAGAGLRAYFAGHAGADLGLWAVVLARGWLLVPLLAGGVWVWRRGGLEPVIASWVLACTLLILGGLDVWYPWYFAWPLALALVGWEGLFVPLVIASNTLALMTMSFYSR
jgi:hypothetical protein